MACPRCGATSPETSAGGLCNSCRYKMAMEDAAKRLDFVAAAQFRDQMYDLQAKLKELKK